MRPLSRATVGVAVRGTHACRRCYGSGKPAGTEDDTVNNRRYFTFLTVAAAVASVVALHDAEAQDWPSRPVTMVVPFAAGRASDTLARILGCPPVGALGPAGGHRERQRRGRHDRSRACRQGGARRLPVRARRRRHLRPESNA